MAAPKKSNKPATYNRGAGQRRTGGQAGGRAGKPSTTIAGANDKTVRVPASWNATTVDPTNQRGSGQRPTGGLAGGRAGTPDGTIARPPAKPAATPKPAGPNSRQTANSNYANGRMGGGVGRIQFLPNSKQAGTNLPSQGANALTTPRNSASPAATPLVKAGSPAGPTNQRGAGQRPTGGQAGGRAGTASGAIARPPGMPNLRQSAGTVAQSGTLASILYEAGKAIRSISPLDPKNQAAARRSDPNAQPLRTMTAAEMRNAPRLEQYNPDAVKPKPPNKRTTKPVSRATPKPAQPARSSGSSAVRSPVRPASASKPGQSSDMNANYKAWAAANPTLAAKVKRGQSGYEAIKGKPAPANEAASPAKSDALKISADSGKNFRTDISLMDKKKKKVNG